MKRNLFIQILNSKGKYEKLNNGKLILNKNSICNNSDRAKVDNRYLKKFKKIKIYKIVKYTIKKK